MLEAFLYFIVAFLVTSGLIPVLFGKDDSKSSQTVSKSSKPVPPPPPNKSKFDVFEDYYYTLKDSGMEIEGAVYTSRQVLRIPSTINYVPVRFIGDKAFQDCKNLRQVLIPECVVRIGRNAFPASKDLTIYAHAGSYAEQYAKENHIAFVDERYFDNPKAQEAQFSASKAQTNTAQNTVNDKTTSAEKKQETTHKTDLPKTIRLGYYDVIKENGGLTIKKFVGVDKAVLTVPMMLDDIPVRVIDTGAFSDCKYIEKVIIGEGILAIRSGAFADCPNLRSVVLPSTLKSFGDDSESKKSASQQAVFHNCRLQSINMPPAIINIGERAFYDCNLLKDIMLPDGLEVIGAEAFWGCTSLSKILIPKSVQTIGKDVFKTKGEGNRKRNLNITLYCYGGSAGLEYARANNLAYKDAEELEKAEPKPKAEQKPKVEEKQKTEIKADQKQQSATVKKVKVKSEAKVNAQKKQENFPDFSQEIAHAVNKAKKLAETPLDELFATYGNKQDNSKAEHAEQRAQALVDVHSCLQQIHDKQAAEFAQKANVLKNCVQQIAEQKDVVKSEQKFLAAIEYDIAETNIGRVIRHSKYTVIFRVKHVYKADDFIDGELIVWEGGNCVSWPFGMISGCEYFKDGKQESYYGRLTKLSKDKSATIGNIQLPKNGLIIHFKGNKPYVILDFVRSSENLAKTYETIKYVIGDRSGRNPFRKLSK